MSQNAEIPAGWYPDPSGAPQTRWWDGSNWAESAAQPAAASTALAIASTPQPTSGASFMESLNLRKAAGWYPDESAPGQQRWWDGDAWTAQVIGAPYQAVSTGYTGAPAGTSPYNRQIWAIVAIYAVMSVISIGVVYWMFANLSLVISNEAAFLGMEFGLAAVGLAAWIVTGFLAYSDQKDLAARGVDHPFNWAFVCIPSYGPTIYIIGRSVVARRRTGSGIAPIWWHVGFSVGSGLIASIVMIAALSTFMV